MRLLLLLTAVFLAGPCFSEEPFLKPNAVIALVGGEDMVVANELGYLETFAHAALPTHRLKFRSLAWEGDTVFEQRRDLNYPPLDAQLDKIGATVVIAQFGQMESLGGGGGIEAFLHGYEKLIARLKGTVSRRVILVQPRGLARATRPVLLPPQPEGAMVYIGSIDEEFGTKVGCRVVPSVVNDFLPGSFEATRDGLHLTPEMHAFEAAGIVAELVNQLPGSPHVKSVESHKMDPELERLRAAVIAKNRLWFHYSRPQNWAFLAGDRTNQPSSRDHIDRNKRWFPDELEKFVPLIDAKEKEIWELAAKLNP